MTDVAPGPFKKCLEGYVSPGPGSYLTLQADEKSVLVPNVPIQIPKLAGTFVPAHFSKAAGVLKRGRSPSLVRDCGFFVGEASMSPLHEP